MVWTGGDRVEAQINPIRRNITQNAQQSLRTMDAKKKTDISTANLSTSDYNKLR